MIQKDICVVFVLVERSPTTYPNLLVLSNDVGMTLQDSTFRIDFNVITTLHFWKMACGLTTFRFKFWHFPPIKFHKFLHSSRKIESNYSNFSAGYRWFKDFLLLRHPCMILVSFSIPKGLVCFNRLYFYLYFQSLQQHLLIVEHLSHLIWHLPAFSSPEFHLRPVLWRPFFLAPTRLISFSSSHRPNRDLPWFCPHSKGQDWDEH